VALATRAVGPPGSKSARRRLGAQRSIHPLVARDFMFAAEDRH
jgi:hypothetical protein